MKLSKGHDQKTMVMHSARGILSQASEIVDTTEEPVSKR